MPDLYAYQKDGVSFLEQRKGRAIIADAPGLGKTAQTCAYLARDAGRLPALVVAPSSVLGSWARELRTWAPRARPAIVTSRQRVPRPVPGRVWIASWDTGTQLTRLMARARLQTVVFDEAHYAKNAGSNRSEGAASLADITKHCILLTGTPIENNLIDFWHLLRLVDPMRFGDKREFLSELAQGGDRAQALKETIEQYVLRRTKTAMLKELPTKTRTKIWFDLPLDAQDAYQLAKDEIESVLLDAVKKRRVEAAIDKIRAGAKPLAAIRWANNHVGKEYINEDTLGLVAAGYMRRLTTKAKLPQCMAWILDKLQTENQLVVFVAHTNTREQLCGALARARVPYVYVDGSVASAEERTRRVELFQKGRARVFIGGMHSAGTGITLTAAKSIVLVERALKPSVEEQTEDRIHRLGQTHPVTVYKLMARGTYDERLDEINTRKEGIISGVLETETVLNKERKTAGKIDPRLVRDFYQAIERAIMVEDPTISLADLRRALSRAA